MVDMKSRVAAVVRGMRVSRGLSQEKVAELVDISTQALSAIENGKSAPSVPTLMLLADSLGFSVEDLMTAENIPPHRLILEAKARALIRDLPDDLAELAMTLLESVAEHGRSRLWSQKQVDPSSDN